MKKTILNTALLAVSSISAHSAIFINEFHYDNAGGDSGEFIEIVTTAGESAANITVTLYNGSNSSEYDTFALTDFVDHGILSDGNNYFSIAITGLQNGGPDGISVDLSGTVQEFISYEGVIASAADGPAMGLASTDVEAFQSSATLVGSSIQRVDFGSTWLATDGSNTQGAINFVPEPSSTALIGLSAFAFLLRRRR